MSVSAPRWWADFRVVYPDAARAALASVRNFVRVGGGALHEGFAQELRLVEDSRDTRGPELGRVYVTHAWDRMRVVAESEEGREHARRVLEMVLGSAVRFAGAGSE